MNYSNLRVLLVIEQCNPSLSSVPFVSYKFFESINKLVNVTLVTHIRNQKAIQEKGHQNVIYIPESKFSRIYYKTVVRPIGSRIWPLYHTLNYPIYAEFNHRVYQQFGDRVRQGEYDLVHVMTPMMPRYPSKLIRACRDVPFILGPVNGGIPFPKGFQDVAKKEFAQLNFLRVIGRLLIPGYHETYEKADKILAGSSYTLSMLKRLFSLENSQIELLYENGISQEFLNSVQQDLAHQKSSDDRIQLLFVGRLVPYKGADMLLEAMSHLQPPVRDRVMLTIVGDGQERQNLEQLTQTLNLQELVQFAGWVTQEETLSYYQQADIFCFPSVREFGGAVSMEAMACGLPCVVINYGGISEYVSSDVGFKIEPHNRAYVIEKLTEHITELVQNDALRQEMSINAANTAKQFEWGQKAHTMIELYQQQVAKKQKTVSIQQKVIEVPT
jgi:glycosyltransferase involved in cell wall biosynthesis